MDTAQYRSNLASLIEYLCEEEGVRKPAATDLQAMSTDDLFQLFRGLVNVRVPATAPEWFYRMQDETLQAATAAKGIAHVADLPRAPRDPRIALYGGDICAIDADAIVNAANSQMLGCWVPGHNCIDNAIHTFAGVQLREECKRIMDAQGHEEPTGQAKVTPAYNLPCKYIVHTVGPISQGRTDKAMRDLLASSYRSCLDAAAEHGCASIVFCCISTGVFGFPGDVAAEVAVATVREWLAARPGTGMTVVFDLFAERDRGFYRNLLGSW